MKEINKIIHDERTYIESVGKQDKETVREALADKGADTILRVGIGVSGQEMPLRALGYFASALAVKEHYFPESELQFVYPLLAAEKINGVGAEQGYKHAQDLDSRARSSFGRHYRASGSEAVRVKSFLDGELPDADLQAAVAEVLAAEPHLASPFQSSAKIKGGDFVTYIAAHVLMHDTNPTLQSLLGEDAAPGASRIISVGAQSERPFYLARMACQRARLLPNTMQVATGQLFTRHVIAPYLGCREGEPLLNDYQVPAQHPVASVQRDLEYLYKALAAETIEVAL